MIYDVHYHLSKTKFDKYSLEIEKDFIFKTMPDFINQVVVFPYFIPGSYFIRDGNLFIFNELAKDSKIKPAVRFRLPFNPWKDFILYYQSFKSSGIPHTKAILKSLFLLRSKKKLIPPSSYYVNDFDFLEKFINYHRPVLIKFHDYQDGTLDYETFLHLLEYNIPLLLHITPFKLEFFLKNNINSTTPLIIAHLGVSGAGMEEEKVALKLAKNFENIFLETGGISDITIVTEILQTIPQKLLFGSDGPVFSPKAIEHTLKDACSIVSFDYNKLLYFFAENTKLIFT